jgi:hypothetical protein
MAAAAAAAAAWDRAFRGPTMAPPLVALVTGDTKAKVGKGRKRKREAEAIGNGGRFAGGAAPTTAAPVSPGQGGDKLAGFRPRQTTQSHRW